jgi:hypothetical protein
MLELALFRACLLDIALKNTGANGWFVINSELGSYLFCMKQNIILTHSSKTTPAEMEIKSISISEYFKLKKLVKIKI